MKGNIKLRIDILNENDKQIEEVTNHHLITIVPSVHEGFKLYAYYTQIKNLPAAPILSSRQTQDLSNGAGMRWFSPGLESL